MKVDRAPSMKVDVLPKPADLHAVADPSSDVRFGSAIAILFFVMLGSWAAVARLDAAAMAPGVLEVSGQRQSVQHRDGGVVGAILAHEGQRVVRGQVVVQLAAAEVVAEEHALAAQAINLLAQRARLEAEQLGSKKVTAPPEFATLPENERSEGALALRLQQAELVARRDTLLTQRSVFGQREQQSAAQGHGYDTQLHSTEEQLKLIDDQLTALRPVTERGFVSKTRLREVERTHAALVGERGQYAASVAQSREAMGENRASSLQAERTFHERAASDLRDVDMRLSDVLPKLVAARDQLSRTAIRAPTTGSVVSLAIFTPGGVVGPGQKLMDIVPEATPLRVQARFSPDDIDGLHIGQRTVIKFPGLHNRMAPTLYGWLTRLSPDAITDEKTGKSFFTAEIVIPHAELANLDGSDGLPVTLRAGMPVQVLVPLRSRTALDYLFEPLVSGFWGSMRER